MNNIFDYKPRNRCVCGNTLSGKIRKIDKKASWGNVSFVLCSDCGSWIQSPQITTESLARWYSSEMYYKTKTSDGENADSAYKDYFSEETHRKSEAEKRFQADLRKILKPESNVLEIGCATASLLSVIKDNGHTATGVDLSSEFAKQAKLVNKIDVIEGNFLNIDFPENHFDAVIMMGTISNLPDLETQLKRIYAILKEDGCLYFNMPFANSLPARIYKDKYWMFTPSVCNFMSIEARNIILEKTGFEIVESRNDKQRPSIGKLLGHMKAQRLYNLAVRLGLQKVSIPFIIPVPGVNLTLCRKPSTINKRR